jgi:hypothetical protein
VELNPVTDNSNFSVTTGHFNFLATCKDMKFFSQPVSLRQRIKYGFLESPSASQVKVGKRVSPPKLQLKAKIIPAVPV